MRARAAWAFLLLALPAANQLRFEGQPVSPEQRASLRLEREKKAAASLGLSFENGRWVIPADRLGRSGEKAPEGKSAGPPPAGKSSWTLEKIAQSSNLSLEVYDTLHCRIAGSVDRPRLRDLGQAAEKTWVAFQKLQFGETGSGLGALDANLQSEDGGRFLLLWARDRASFQKLTASLEGRRSDVALVLEEGKSRTEAIQEGTHRFAHALLRRFHFDGKSLPDWYEEGFACLMDLKSGSAVPRPCRAQGNWMQSARELHAQRKLRPLKVLVGLGVEEMSAEDVLQSMSLVEFLAKRSSLPRMQEALRANAPSPGSPFPRGVDAVRPHEEAFRSALGTPSWDALETAWKGMLEAAR